MLRRLQPALAALATLVLVAGCSSTGSSPSASGAAPSTAASTAASAAPTSTLKIGLVTDVGKLNDQNFNQYSWEGAQDAAKQIGAPAPKSAQSVVSADIKKNIQAFVDQKFDVIVTVGFAATADTTTAAKANPKIKFIGVDQVPCVTPTGDNDPKFGCKGDPASLLPNYQGLSFKEQQPGYLAGIVAASISKSHHIMAIAGTYSVPSNPNYVIGYLNGAKSVDPTVKVEIKYISPAPDKAAFADPPGGKAFAQQQLATFKDVDVIFQVAGATGNGVLQAACDAKIFAIGVDVDQFLSTPATKGCTVTSAEKNVHNAVLDAIKRVAAGADKGGTIHLDNTSDSVGLAPFHDSQSMDTSDLQAKIDKAITDL
ncbi:MAG: BMP family ABC transporter substrate-binding protein, partial [Candidatus Limnocylindrales bacterium]